MILSTTDSIEGKRIIAYKGIVLGEVIIGANVLKDFMSAITDFFGGRSAEYEKVLVEARNKALDELEDQAYELGANAVIGIDLDYEVLGRDNGMLMVSANGTAVLYED